MQEHSPLWNRKNLGFASSDDEKAELRAHEKQCDGGSVQDFQTGVLKPY